ncbi:MAG: GNAT family N-acetyltransferase [Gammaproteobacteria bacterium]|nr:GNAT family N-acetyltransferase [Gammaproteobacteria bacterium]MDH3553389.1 GNAT family N-acetyltransferase [Gammaproteobacteria bacterium]
MTNLTVSSQAPTDWARQCSEREFLFHSPDWAALLEASFNVKTHYILDETEQGGFAVSSFRAGPFWLGYLGFPYGGMVGNAVLGNALLQDLRVSLSGFPPVAIRIPVSAFAESSVDLDFPYVQTPETAIADLPSWTPDAASENHRRDIKKAARSGLEITDARGSEDAAAIFRIYRDTVKRHRGGLRYNKTYFANLVDLAQSNDRVRVRLARLDDNTAGFIVVVRHGFVACYLHGGLNLQYRHCRPAALLFSEAIEWAQGLGCECFNLMSSPPDQQSLVAYKERWGARTREHRTYTVPLRRSYRFFQLAERLYGLVR